MSQERDTRDYLYLTMMDEMLRRTAQYIEECRYSDDDVRLGAYLRLASRSLRFALEIYRDHLAQICAEMKQGEEVQ